MLLLKLISVKSFNPSKKPCPMTWMALLLKMIFCSFGLDWKRFPSSCLIRLFPNPAWIRLGNGLKSSWERYFNPAFSQPRITNFGKNLEIPVGSRSIPTERDPGPSHTALSHWRCFFEEHDFRWLQSAFPNCCRQDLPAPNKRTIHRSLLRSFRNKSCTQEIDPHKLRSKRRRRGKMSQVLISYKIKFCGIQILKILITYILKLFFKTVQILSQFSLFICTSHCSDKNLISFVCSSAVCLMIIK